MATTLEAAAVAGAAAARVGAADAEGGARQPNDAAPAAKGQPHQKGGSGRPSSGGGGGAALVRLLAAAFSAGSSEAASGPSPRIRAGGGGFEDNNSNGGGNGLSTGGVGPAAAAGRSRTPPLVSEAAAPLAAAPSAGGAGSLGGMATAAAAASTTATANRNNNKNSTWQWWRLGAPPEGRGARVERHGPGPAGGVAGPHGPWGVRGEPDDPEPASLDYFPRTGVRTFTDGVQGPCVETHGADGDALTPLGRAVAVLTLLGYVGWGHCLLALMFACAWTSSPYAFLLLAAAIGSLFLPAAPLYVRSIHLGPLMRCWRRYFRFSYVFEARLDASRPYVVAQFPHGAFPLGQIVGGSFMACEFEQHTLLGLAASAVFLVPGWRHVNSWFGALPATSHNFRRLLRRCARAARGELLAEGERAETEAIEADAREARAAAQAAAEAAAEAAALAASAEAEAAAARVAAAEVAAAAEAEAAKAKQRQQQQQQREGGGTPSPSAKQHQHQRRSPSPHRRGGGVGAASTSRPTSAPISGPFSSPGAARPLLTDLLKDVPGLCVPAAPPSASATAAAAAAATSPAAAGGGGGFGLAAAAGRPLQATVSAPPAQHHLLPLRSADAERAATLARMRRADSILSDPGGRALAGRGLSDDESESGSGGGSAFASRAGSEELSSDPSVILVGASPAAVLEEDEEEQEQEDAGEQQQQGGDASAAGGLRRRKGAAVAAASNGGGSDPDDLRPGSPAPGSPRAADPAAPSTPRAPLSPRERPATRGAAAASSRPGTAGLHHHHHHHGPAPIPANLLPPLVPGSDGEAVGAGPAPKHRHPGTSVAVMVGGIAEMFMLRRDAEVLKLRSRKGFVRLALEHGTDILPTYLFGNSAILDFGPRWLQQASRRWRASFGLMYGPWGLPLPRRVPILMAVGAPVSASPAMAPTDPGFEARVDEIHAAVCLEIARVYYRWREEYGWPDRPLIIA